MIDFAFYDLYGELVMARKQRYPISRRDLETLVVSLNDGSDVGYLGECTLLLELDTTLNENMVYGRLCGYLEEEACFGKQRLGPFNE